MNVVADRPGFALVRDQALELADAALAEGDPAAEIERLRHAGYRRGRARTWADATGATVFVSEYELHDEPAAALYVADGLHRVQAQALQPIEVGHGFAVTACDTDGFVGHVASVAAGRWHVLAVVDARTGLSLADTTAIALARRSDLLRG